MKKPNFLLYHITLAEEHSSLPKLREWLAGGTKLAAIFSATATLGVFCLEAGLENLADPTVGSGPVLFALTPRESGGGGDTTAPAANFTITGNSSFMNAGFCETWTATFENFDESVTFAITPEQSAYFSVEPPSLSYDPANPMPEQQVEVCARAVPGATANSDIAIKITRDNTEAGSIIAQHVPRTCREIQEVVTDGSGTIACDYSVATGVKTCTHANGDQRITNFASLERFVSGGKVVGIGAVERDFFSNSNGTSTTTYVYDPARPYRVTTQKIEILDYSDGDGELLINFTEYDAFDRPIRGTMTASVIADVLGSPVKLSCTDIDVTITYDDEARVVRTLIDRTDAAGNSIACGVLELLFGSPQPIYETILTYNDSMWELRSQNLDGGILVIDNSFTRSSPRTICLP